MFSKSMFRSFCIAIVGAYLVHLTIDLGSNVFLWNFSDWSLLDTNAWFVWYVKRIPHSTQFYCYRPSSNMWDRQYVYWWHPGFKTHSVWPRYQKQSQVASGDFDHYLGSCCSHYYTCSTLSKYQYCKQMCHYCTRCYCKLVPMPHVLIKLGRFLSQVR